MKKLLLLLLLCAAVPAIADESEKSEVTTKPEIILNVPVVEAKEGVIAEKYSTQLTVEANRRTILMAQTPGPISAIKAKVGDNVKAGDLLLEVSHPTLDAQIVSAAAQLTAAQVQVNSAKDGLARQKRLLAAKYITPQALEGAQAAYKAAVAQRNAAAGAVKSAESGKIAYQITAPFDGTILRDFDLVEGQTIAPGQSLFDIADTSVLLAKVQVPEQYVSKIALDKPVTITLHSGDTLEGKILSRDKFVDQTSRTVGYKLQLNGEALLGAFGDATFVLKEEKGIIVPTGAVVQGKTTSRIYYIDEDKVAIAEVKTGLSDSNNIVVTEGLNDGARVIIRGQSTLKEGVKVKGYSENN